MEWLWAPAVALVGVFVLVLCCLFFKDYTCFPCRKKKPPCIEDGTTQPQLAAIDTPPTLRPTPQPPPPTSFFTVEREVRTRPRPRAPPPPPPPRPRNLSRGRDRNRYHFEGNVKSENVLRIQNGVPTLDLHHLSVKEAVHTTETFLKQSRRDRYKHVRIITGRGLHSVDGVAKIKPAIESLLGNRRYKETAKGGCLEVSL